MSLDSNLKVNTEIVKLEGDTLIELYTIDTSTVVKDPFFDFRAIKYYFHPYHIRPEDSNGATEADKDKGVLVCEGQEYNYYPVSAEGFELTGDGSLPRPVFRVANIFPIIKDLTLNLGDLVGATFRRKRIFKRFLDNQDTSDTSAMFEEDVYIISRKKIENRIYIEFEMVTIAEANNIQIPKRQVMQNFCSWKYRGDGCGYVRMKIIDINNVEYGVADNYEGNQNLPDPVPWMENSDYATGIVVYHVVNGIKQLALSKLAHTSSFVNRYSNQYWIMDVCSKGCPACKMRWQSNQTPDTVLPFGGFVGANRRIV